MWRLRRRRAAAPLVEAAPSWVGRTWQPPSAAPEAPEPATSTLAAAEHPVPPPRRTRVELGFADGAVAELDPDSAQARALVVVARSLASSR